MPYDNPVLRSNADTILKTALAAVDPERAVTAHLSIQGRILRCGSYTFDLSDYTKILVTGAGKAGAPMASAIEDVLGDLLQGGIVVVKDGHVRPVKKIKILV